MRTGWAERQCRVEFAEGRREVQHKWSAIRSEWDPASRLEVVETCDTEPIPSGPPVP
jgi:hypothetical protein